MLRTDREGTKFRIETGAAVLEWDAARGGQVTGFAVKDEAATHSLLANGCVLPNLRLKDADGYLWRLADFPATLEVVHECPDCVHLKATVNSAGSGVQVEQDFEVFPEGAVFCEFAVEVSAGHSFRLCNAAMEFPLDVKDAKNLRWGYHMRTPRPKIDATTLHAFTENRFYLSRDDTAEEQQLLPLVSLDLGWDSTRLFSNHVEMALEDWAAIGEGPCEETRTRVGQEDGVWKLRWELYDGRERHLTGPYRYRNRWGLLIGAGRTRAGAGADPAVRNNILGARIAHCIYPHVRVQDAREWPWVVMPIRQVKWQEPQLFAGNPGLERADEAADLGANVMIIHQFWMSNPGSNNEPPADYHPADSEWLKCFIDRCHERGMRVALYMRWPEMYSFYSDFYEEFLRKDFDGLYIDWAFPLQMGWAKTSPLHFSAYNFFQFGRALRRRVGEGGFLIGHGAGNTQLSGCVLDACLSGEFTVLHDILLEEPEACAHFGLHGGCGGNLLGGDKGVRSIFSSERAAAFCAALGMSTHCIMVPNEPFSESIAYIRPLWELMRHLPTPPIRVHNPAVSPTDAVHCNESNLFPLIFQAADGEALLVVTNLDEAPATGTVEVDLDGLGMPGSAQLEALRVEGTGACRVDGERVHVENLPPLRFCGALIRLREGRGAKAPRK